MRKLLAIVGLGAVLTSCAALNTESMSPSCRDSYNDCLDGCPRAPSVDPASPGVHDGPYIGTALCTEACNSTAKSCR